MHLRSGPGVSAKPRPAWLGSSFSCRSSRAGRCCRRDTRWTSYLFINGQNPYFLRQLATQGRALVYLLNSALAALGAPAAHSQPLSQLLLTFVLVAVGLIVCRLWGTRGFAENFIVVSLVVLHPYQSEIFTFRSAALNLAIALGLAFGAILVCTRSTRYWIVSAVALVCSLSIYQVVLNYLGMALVFSLAFHLTRPAGSNPAFWPGLRSRLKLILTALIFYYAATYTVSRILGAALAARGAFIGTNEIAPRIDQIVALYKVILFQAEPVLPTATKALLLLTLAAAIAVHLVTSWRGRAYPALRRHALAFTLAVVAGLPLCAGVVLVLGEWWPVPRVLAQTGMLWGGSLALVYSMVQPIGRRLILAGLIVILVSFIGISNEVFNDQLRVNMRDLATASRIAGRIEALPDFAQVRYLAVSGGPWGYESPIWTAEGNLNVSAFSEPWSKVPLINEASGHAFKPAPRDMLEKANALCASKPKWPALESISKIDATVVVCMQN